MGQLITCFPSDECAKQLAAAGYGLPYPSLLERRRMQEFTRIREVAFMSVGRACMFGVIAIWTLMMGLIMWPALALKAGALGTTLAGAILLLKAMRATRRSYRRTETWILLGREHGLPEERAQPIITGILRDTYLRFAEYAAVITVVLWIAAFLFWLAGSTS